MQFVVQVRPYPRPHHEADVLIPVFHDDDVDRLVRWFEHNNLDTVVHRLGDDDDVSELAAADQLIMTLADLSVSGEAVLRTAIQNGERMRRADRRALASDLRRPPDSNTTNNRSRESPPLSSSTTTGGGTTAAPRRVTTTPLPLGGAGGETTSPDRGTGRRNATTAVREGILLPVVPEYESPGAHLDSLFGRDVPFGDDVPMRLFGDDDDSFAVEINHSFAAQRHHGSTTSSAPPASLSFSHLGGGEQRQVRDHGGRVQRQPRQ